MAFAVRKHDPPAIEVRINFGVFAGRDATAAEIERLAQWLLDEVGEVSIISEERHEIDAQVEASGENPGGVLPAHLRDALALCDAYEGSVDMRAKGES